MESKADGELVVGKLYTSFTSPELWYHHAYFYIPILYLKLGKGRIADGSFLGRCITKFSKKFKALRNSKKMRLFIHLDVPGS